jgi:uncharacterized protein (TIGR02118 family)
VFERPAEYYCDCASNASFSRTSYRRANINQADHSQKESRALMSKLIVLYPAPENPDQFARYFRETHMPLVRKMPGLKDAAYGPSTSLDGTPGSFFWTFVGTFDSLQAIHDALGSPAGKATVADIPNYSPKAPTILHLDDSK